MRGRWSPAVAGRSKVFSIAFGRFTSVASCLEKSVLSDAGCMNALR